ncbi:MAG: hypothetical protein AVDCRST_MAG47-167, partial [uncultured Nocardioidaceae bacterium]
KGAAHHPADREPVGDTDPGTPLQAADRQGQEQEAVGAVDQPAQRPARRLRHRQVRADLHRQRRAHQPARGPVSRGRGARAVPRGAGQRRERLRDPVRHPLQRHVLRQERDGRQPELHRRPRPPRDPRRPRRGARQAGLRAAQRRPTL